MRAKVKLPTADKDKNLGTGEVDYTLELTPFKKMGDTTLYGALGFKKYGDTRETDYRDVWLARAGVMQQLNAHNKAGLSYRVRQKTTARRSDKRSLMAFHTYTFDKQWQLQSYVIKGFSDANADWAGGVALIHDL